MLITLLLQIRLLSLSLALPNGPFKRAKSSDFGGQRLSKPTVFPKSLLGIAQTGSEKKAAFALPSCIAWLRIPMECLPW
ncbi:hypothetical protein SLEP1_g38302 [Rubroshorea leprosula]|uniref:Secreted protein n=1 Tax=Rubroshorea leprosula TaxID=152421 RepID=A0AAV5KXI6_9ROSI|nr:hypothetical protein SLEP1_g38302 [Rubroshorea leprosula]